MNTLVVQLLAPDPVRGVLPVEVLEWNDPDQPPSGPIAEAELPWPPPPRATSDGAPAIDLASIPAPLTGSEDEPQLRAIGNFLRESLEHGAVAARLRAATTLPSGPGAAEAPATRVLLDIADPTVRDLPWEALSRSRTWLAASDTRLVSRARLGPAPTNPPACRGPIRVLAILGSADNDPHAANDEAVEAIEDAVIGAGPCVDLHILRAGGQLTKAEIVAEYRRFEPHILHFYGHGAPATANSDAALLIAAVGPAIGDDPWTATEIRNALAAQPPWLSVIAACHSGAAATSGMWSVVEPFLDIGVPAVIGMNGAVDAATARRLCARFYLHLLGPTSLPVDAALAQARRDVIGGASVDPHVLMPTLTFQCHPDRALLRRDRDGGAIAYARCQEIRHRHDFAGRWEERRSAIRNLIHLARQGRAARKVPNVVVLHGEEKTGKTELVKVLSRLCVEEGIAVAYASMREDTQVGWHAVLRRMRDAIERAPLLDAAAVRHAFTAFDARHRAFAPGSTAAPIAGLATGLATGLAMGLGHSHAEDGRGELFDLFATAIQSLTATTPLVIVLDQLGVLPAEWRDEIMVRLILPAAAGPALGRCRLVIIAATQEIEPLRLDTITGSAEVVGVRPFEPSESARVVGEWLRRLLDHDDAKANLDIAGNLRTAWKPVYFDQLLKPILAARGVRIPDSGSAP